MTVSRDDVVKLAALAHLDCGDERMSSPPSGFAEPRLAAIDDDHLAVGVQRGELGDQRAGR